MLNIESENRRDMRSHDDDEIFSTLIGSKSARITEAYYLQKGKTAR